MNRFSHFMAIDWSGAVGAFQPGIAVALCRAGDASPVLLAPPQGRRWSREGIAALLLERLPADTLVGLDLGMALPFADAGAYFPGWKQSPPDARTLWRLVEETCAADPHLSATSFVEQELLARYFRRHGGGEGALFHHPDAAHRRGRFRVTELAQARMGCRPYSNFNLVGAAQVGKSSLTGMRLLHRLDGHLPVWPFDPLPAIGPVVVEIYTALAAIAAGRPAGRSKIRSGEELDEALAALGSAPSGRNGAIEDHASDALLTAAWLRHAAPAGALWQPAELTGELARTEGWTFGAT